MSLRLVHVLTWRRLKAHLIIIHCSYMWNRYNIIIYVCGLPTRALSCDSYCLWYNVPWVYVYDEMDVEMVGIVFCERSYIILRLLQMNVFFLIITKDAERPPRFSQHLCAADMRLLLAKNKENSREKLGVWPTLICTGRQRQVVCFPDMMTAVCAVHHFRKSPTRRCLGAWSLWKAHKKLLLSGHTTFHLYSSKLHVWFFHISQITRLLPTLGWRGLIWPQTEIEST